MDVRWLTALFRIAVVLLMLANVTMHGVVALFIGGPAGLVLYLIGFCALWGGGWYAVHKWRQAARGAPPTVA